MLLAVSGLLGLLVLGAGDPQAPNVEITPVLHQGDPAPGIPGATMVWFFTPHIDGAGNVLVHAFFQMPGESVTRIGLWYGCPGELAPVVHEGTQAPDLPAGVVYDEIDVVWLSENGWIGFRTSLSGPGIVPGFNDYANFVGPPGDIRKALQGGDPAPELEPGTIIDVSNDYGLNAELSDNATLMTKVWLSGPEVDDDNDEAIYVGPRDGLRLVWRKGMQAPGTEPGVTFAWISLLRFNDLGQIAFRAGLAGDSVDDTNDMGRWIGGAGDLSLVTRAGDVAPGFPEEITLAGAGGGLTTTNSQGDTTELTLLQGPGITEDNDLILYAGQPGNLHIIRREGDSAPEAGEDVEIDGFGNPLINQKRELFEAIDFRGPSIDEGNNRGLYHGPHDDQTLILREGDPAPQLPKGVLLGPIGGGTTALNDVGDILKGTYILSNDADSDQSVVVWWRDYIRGRWYPFLSDGQDVAGRTISIPTTTDLLDMYWDKTGGSDGARQSVNDSGGVAVKISFTDGSHGVFLVQPAWVGDFDGDRDVDFGDFMNLQQCLDGSNIVDPGSCEAADLDGDGDVDLFDYSLFLDAVTGPH